MENSAKNPSMGTHAILLRNEKNTKQIISTILFYDGFNNLLGTIRALELPMKGGELRNFTLGTGTYQAKRVLNEKYGICFEVHGQHESTGLLIRVGNFPFQTKACILVGQEIHEIDCDSNVDVTNSVQAIREMVSMCSNEFNLTVVEALHVSGISLVY